MRESKVPYEGLGRKSWVIMDGILDRVLQTHVKGEWKTALDIGCGSGFVARHLQKTFETVLGLDLENYLHDDLKSSVKFSSADLNFEKLPYADGSIDCVTCFQVIEHLENPFFVPCTA